MVQHPGFSLAGLGLLVIVGHSTQQLVLIALAHRATAADWGQYGQWSVLSWSVTTLLVPVLLTGLAWHRVRRVMG